MEGGEMKKWPNCRLKLPRSRNRFKFLSLNESASSEFSTAQTLLGFDVKNENLFQFTVNQFDKLPCVPGGGDRHHDLFRWRNLQ